jgi:transcriptional regulator with XRE-family HTH domain
MARRIDPLAQRLAIVRIEIGLTQEQLAHKMGRENRTTIANWETGRNFPNLASLRQWAAALGHELTLVPTIIEEKP